MSAVFVSYKREDEERVEHLVRALESAGLTVWWDGGLAGGQNWRLEIQCALDAARCVIVAWTHHSVGPSGDFVRDEAAHAKRRGILVPVRLDDVAPPIGFGEVQSIDLTHWRGHQRDPHFQDVVSAVRAKLEGRPPPLATGPTKRLAKRLALGTVISTVVSFGAAFGSNVFRIQDRTCAMPFLQPHISDTCGAAGLGSRPMSSERIAWEERESGSCEALRVHVARFPSGAYREEATSMLAARRVARAETWEPTQRSLTLFVGQSDKALRDEVQAQEAALRSARVAAEQLCRGFTATTSFRFGSAAPVVHTWDCSQTARGVTCGFDGSAVCELAEKRVQESETCGLGQ